GAIFAVLFLLPLLDKVLPRGLAHFLACSFVFALVGGAGFLTFPALSEDAHNEKFQADRALAERAAAPAKLMAARPEVGFPPEGAGCLLARDPLYHGTKVLQTKCLGCHYYGGKGQDKQAAPDLLHYGSRSWLRGLLEDPNGPGYFGKAKGCGAMGRWR